MILTTLDGVTAEEFAERTDWHAKPQGLCRGEVCVPAPGSIHADGSLDIQVVADRLGMPLIHDETHGLWALGPATVGGRALDTVVAADPELLSHDGGTFRLSQLRGRKVVMVAWASY